MVRNGCALLTSVDAGRDFESERVEGDEAGGIALVVRLGGIGLHGSDVGVVKTQRTLATSGNHVPFVEFDSDHARYVTLGFGHQTLER